MEYLWYARFLFKGLMTCSNSFNPQNNGVRQALIADLRGEVEGAKKYSGIHTRSSGQSWNVRAESWALDPVSLLLEHTYLTSLMSNVIFSDEAQI